MNVLILERAVAVLTVLFTARVWSRWRVAHRGRAALITPLVDVALLEAVFAPRLQDGDDPDLLAELRDTFLHLNRRAYAEEFWGMHTQIVALYETLDDPQRATLRRAIVRLLTANDRWLQLVGAKTALELKIPEAIPSLQTLLENDDSHEAADIRFREELEKAFVVLTEQGGKQTRP